jgi:hypothetical protein
MHCAINENSAQNMPGEVRINGEIFGDQSPDTDKLGTQPDQPTTLPLAGFWRCSYRWTSYPVAAEQI